MPARFSVSLPAAACLPQAGRADGRTGKGFCRPAPLVAQREITEGVGSLVLTPERVTLIPGKTSATGRQVFKSY